MTTIIAQATQASADPSTTTMIAALLLGNLVGVGLLWWRRQRKAKRDNQP